MDQIQFNEQFRQRTKILALNIIHATANLKYTDATSVLRKQLIRSVTSVAANYRAVGRSRSPKERYAKLCIVVEEADETIFWLELLSESGFINQNDLIEINAEAMEILKVMSSYKKKLHS